MSIHSFIFFGGRLTRRSISTTHLFCWKLSFVVLILFTFTIPSQGQDALFGSIDDPSEALSRVKSPPQSAFEGGAGFSLIGPQWYTAASAKFMRRGEQSYVRLVGVIRTGLYGAYGPDSDETYDLARLIQVARYQSFKTGSYLRLGPLSRTRLGSGLLVNFLNTEAAWDDRTVGIEARVSTNTVTFEGFSEDAFSVGLIGARLSLTPFARMNSPFSTLMLSASVVSDQKMRLARNHPVDGQEVGIRIQAYAAGGFSFFPFINVARIPEFGQGIAFGADLENDNFIDFARLHFRLALHYNSSDFRSGYFGSFYTVNSHRAQVLTEKNSDPAGFELREIERGNSIESEIRLLVFNRIEFWYAFFRYHGVQPLSEYHLRLRFNTNRFNVSIGQDRAGLVGFRSLFNSLGDENRLRFEFEYRIFGPLWAKILADYTYKNLGDSESDIPKFIVQRRFSPVLTLRYPASVRW
jgi:hypothetical protein